MANSVIPAAGPKIQSGVFSGTTGQYGQVSITLSSSFSSAPTVFATMMRDYKYKICYSTRNASEIGFQIYNNDNSAVANQTVQFCWIAVGPTSS